MIKTNNGTVEIKGGFYYSYRRFYSDSQGDV